MLEHTARFSCPSATITSGAEGRKEADGKTIYSYAQRRFDYQQTIMLGTKELDWTFNR
jgi:hypothetical protein